MLAGILLVLGVAGGAVWLRDVGKRRKCDGCTPCVPAPDTFSGISETAGTWKWSGRTDPFETCYQFRDTDIYCWSHSYYDSWGTDWFECIPRPQYENEVAGLGTPSHVWHDIDPKYVNTPGVDPNINPKRCGPPCQDMYQQAQANS